MSNLELLPINIAGEWRLGGGGESTTLYPATGEVVGRLRAPSLEDVEEAIQKADHAFRTSGWAQKKPHERAAVLHRVAQLIRERAEPLAQLQRLDNGKPIKETRMLVASAAATFQFFAAACETMEETITPSRGDFMTMSVYEPMGVVAAITPWNSPIASEAQKLAPALAAGCTLVLKPAEQTPLTALMLAELIQEAGFPPGVFNVVTGDGPGTGAPLVSHPLVNKVSFTGSTEVGKLIGHACMDNMTRITLELGGKSPVIVLDDCDPATAAAGAANAIFFNHGQVCCAGSRLYVHKSMFDRVVADVADQAAQLTLGHGLDPSAQMGPLVSQEQMERVCSYIDIGRSQGAEVVTGGARASQRGYFVQPTVMTGVQHDHRVAREEIFGPVLVAMPYDDLDEVAAWANDTPYGLGASIWSNNLSKVHRLIPKIQSGTVWVNCHSTLDPGMPFGGYKQSGMGRDMGRTALDAYLETKSVFINL